MGCMARRLQNRLRFTEGVSYSVGSQIERLGGGQRHNTLFADCSEGKSQTALDGLVGTLEELAENGHNEADIVAFSEEFQHGQSHAESTLGILDALATRLLLGEEIIGINEWYDRVRSVEPQEVAEIAKHALSTGLYLHPPDSHLPDGKGRLYTAWSADSLSGERFKPLQPSPPPDDKATLTAGDDGLTLSLDSNRRITVEFRETEGVLQWSDGGRLVVGSDAFEITVDPSRWRDGEKLVGMIDDHTPSESHVKVGKRLNPPEGTAGDPLRKRWRQGLGLLPRRHRFFLYASWFMFVYVSIRMAAVPSASRLVTLSVWTLAVIILTTLAWRRMPQSIRRPQLLDSASSHLNDDFPSDLPTSRAFIVCGGVLGWIVDRQISSEWFVKESGEELDAFRKREITAPELYREWDGILALDMLSASGRRFIRWYFPDKFTKDLNVLRGDLPTYYHVADSWENYDLLCRMIDERYRRWRLLAPWRLITEPPLKIGYANP